MLVNVAVVLFMAGFIWTMQLVHYPLFDRVGERLGSCYALWYRPGSGRVFLLVPSEAHRRTLRQSAWRGTHAGPNTSRWSIRDNVGRWRLHCD